MYHRVTELATDPHRLCVSPQHFNEHLAVIRRHFRPLSLLDLFNGEYGDELPDDGVVITFDDGYADNLLWAAPALAAAGLPATVFITTGNIWSGREFWWDELEWIVAQSASAPQRLLTASRTAGVANGSLSPGASNIYQTLHSALRSKSASEIDFVLTELCDSMELERPCREDYRPLSCDEVRRLAQFATIGAHTVTHARLASLSPTEQQDEIVSSKLALEKLIGCSVMAFAYPFGSEDDYSAETLRLVRDAGFLCACTVKSGRSTSESPRLELPRLIVRDWDGDQFLREVGRA